MGKGNFLKASSSRSDLLEAEPGLDHRQHVNRYVRFGCLNSRMENRVAFVYEQIASCKRQLAKEPDKREMFESIIAIYERELATWQVQRDLATPSGSIDQAPLSVIRRTNATTAPVARERH